MGAPETTQAEQDVKPEPKSYTVDQFKIFLAGLGTVSTSAVHELITEEGIDRAIEVYNFEKDDESLHTATEEVHFTDSEPT